MSEIVHRCPGDGCQICRWDRDYEWRESFAKDREFLRRMAEKYGMVGVKTRRPVLSTPNAADHSPIVGGDPANG